MTKNVLGLALLFQSTLPQGERRRAERWCSGGCKISIHAPTRGATCMSRKHHMLYLDFNPRSHKGSDDNSLIFRNCDNISIHAPTRGATRCAGRTANFILFQSTLPQGERRLLGLQPMSKAKFQSTLPQGERPMSVTQSA